MNKPQRITTDVHDYVRTVDVSNSTFIVTLAIWEPLASWENSFVQFKCSLRAVCNVNSRSDLVSVSTYSDLFYLQCYVPPKALR